MQAYERERCGHIRCRYARFCPTLLLCNRCGYGRARERQSARRKTRKPAVHAVHVCVRRIVHGGPKVCTLVCVVCVYLCQCIQHTIDSLFVCVCMPGHACLHPNLDLPVRTHTGTHNNTHTYTHAYTHARTHQAQAKKTHACLINLRIRATASKHVCSNPHTVAEQPAHT